MLRLLIAAFCCCCLLTGCAPVVDTSDTLWKTERFGESWNGAHIDALVHAGHRIETAGKDAEIAEWVDRDGWSVYDPATQPTPQGLIRIPSPHGKFWIKYRVDADGFLSNSAAQRRR